VRYWFGSPFWRSPAIWWILAFVSILPALVGVLLSGLLFGR
jgi:hypothetical protein